MSSFKGVGREDNKFQGVSRPILVSVVSFIDMYSVIFQLFE